MQGHRPQDSANQQPPGQGPCIWTFQVQDCLLHSDALDPSSYHHAAACWYQVHNGSQLQSSTLRLPLDYLLEEGLLDGASPPPMSAVAGGYKPAGLQGASCCSQAHCKRRVSDGSPPVCYPAVAPMPPPAQSGHLLASLLCGAGPSGHSSSLEHDDDFLAGLTFSLPPFQSRCPLRCCLPAPE